MEAPQIAPWSQRLDFHEQARAFYKLSGATRAQRTFEFPPAWDDPELAERLAARSGPLCRYCESVPGPDAGDVRPRHFRPYDGVVTDDRQLLEDHYWWLAYEEDNLLLTCDDCHSRKGKRFPLHGSRAGPETPLTETDETELPALLHPDEFGERLAFGSDGLVSGLDADARETVNLLQLNREWLVSARGEAISLVAGELAGSPSLATSPSELYPNHLSYFHARRQAHRDAASTVEVAEAPTDEVLGEFEWDLTTKASSVVEEAKTEQRGYDVARGTANITVETSFATSRTIERIEIRNFRIIDRLVLNLKGRPGEWRMLLGENGTGKSTLLEAIALTLVDADYRAKLGVTPQSCVRRRCKRGWIEITLAGTEEPVRLEFATDSDMWGGNADAPNTQVLGYGATRLLPRHGARTDDDSQIARTANLFDPFVALSDASAWLASQHETSPARFNAAARLLRQLLDERAAARLRMKGDSVELSENGVWKRFDQLSAGYQTVVALALDMMSVLSEIWPDMAAAEGVVLIDELGSHLHPRWQMRIVSSLRSAFPRLQFIVSTHSPLCLRGLQPDEIVMMRHRLDDPKRVIAVTDLPRIDGLRVDQLLTSPHFGLGTTVDVETERAFQRMYELEQKAGPTTQEIAELKALEERMAGKERLGDTPAQGAMYRAINRLLITDATALASDPRQLGEEALDEIVAMLDRIDRDRARLARRGASTVDDAIIP